MTISNLSGRLAALVAAAVVLAVLLLGWFVLISPQRSKISSLDTQIDGTNAEIASTEAYISSPATKKAIAQLPRYKAMVPDDPRTSRVIRQLAAAASSAQVQLDSITPGSLAPSGSAQALPITLSVEGHYGRLSKFLHLLRAQARVNETQVVGRGRLYSVSGIQFNSGASSSTTTGGAAGGNGAITATITLNAFVNGVVAPVTTPATTTP
jgi:Tfp pilus assembly protein PilO